MNQNNTLNNYCKLVRYTLYGVFFGVLFPVIAWIFEIQSASLSWTRDSLAIIHSKNHMLYMINTAPFFLGLFAFVAGRYKVSTDNYSEELKSLIYKLENKVKERTSELETLNQNLEASYLQASAFAQAQSAFLANMSHEIRTPMNAIIGMANIAEKNFAIPNSEEKVASSIKQILVSSKHLLGLINNILDMSKIEAGEFTLGSDDFSLEELILETQQIITPRCTEKEIKLDIQLHNNTQNIWFNSDKLRIMQVLINLIGNSVKFTPKNGTVTLEVKVSDKINKQYLVYFAIHDTGIGMPESVMKTLFQPFKQADNKVVRQSGGTGLGLAISQNIINLLGSSIKVTSEENKGSTFSFEIFLPEGVPVVQDVETVCNISLAGKRVLLVDDIEINRIIVQELLEDTNITLEMADDGSVAIDMFKGSPPDYYDLILMDVQMPNIDGYTATKAIRALDHPNAKTIPIIAMTANAMKEDVIKAKESQMNDHIGKPIDFDKLISLLHHYLFINKK